MGRVGARLDEMDEDDRDSLQSVLAGAHWADYGANGESS